MDTDLDTLATALSEGRRTRRVRRHPHHYPALQGRHCPRVVIVDKHNYGHQFEAELEWPGGASPRAISIRWFTAHNEGRTIWPGETS